MLNPYALDKTKHFADREPEESMEDHILEQLLLDLDWALENVPIHILRDGEDPLEAIEGGFRATAGRRWQRFKTAEPEVADVQAKEMERLARFWYAVANKLRTIRELTRKPDRQ